MDIFMEYHNHLIWMVSAEPLKLKVSDIRGNFHDCPVDTGIKEAKQFIDDLNDGYCHSCAGLYQTVIYKGARDGKSYDNFTYDRVYIGVPSPFDDSHLIIQNDKRITVSQPSVDFDWLPKGE